MLVPWEKEDGSIYMRIIGGVHPNFTYNFEQKRVRVRELRVGTGFPLWGRTYVFEHSFPSEVRENRAPPKFMHPGAGETIFAGSF